MAKNIGGRSGRTASSTHRVTDNDSSSALWTRRNPASGRFTQSKKTGGAFKGVRRES